MHHVRGRELRRDDRRFGLHCLRCWEVQRCDGGGDRCLHHVHGRVLRRDDRPVGLHGLPCREVPRRRRDERG